MMESRMPRTAASRPPSGRPRLSDVNAGLPGEVISPRTSHGHAGEERGVDLSQIVALGLAEAKWLGLLLLGAGIAVRVGGRALGRVLLAAGILVAAALAYQAWQAMHSLLIAGGILLAGVVVFGLLAWTVRGLSFLFALALMAAAFYLLAYGWAGPSFPNTTAGSLTWAGATILTMIVTGLKGGWTHRMPAVAVGAGLAR